MYVVRVIIIILIMSIGLTHIHCTLYMYNVCLSCENECCVIFSQYLGKQTPPVVKDRIKALLYSWKVGLPTEGKITDAYEMLKKEG